MGISAMTLPQAWDKAALVSDLKARGIPDAEKIVEDVIDSLLSWATASCALLTPTQPLYGLGAVILPQVDAQIDAAINAQVQKL